MSRRIPALMGAALVLALACAAPAQDADPIKAKLDKARAAFEAEVAVVEKTVPESLDRAEIAARTRADKVLLDKIKADRELFELSGALPKSLAVTTQKVDKARKVLDTAYATAVKEYTKANKDTAATAVEKERAKFKDTLVLRPRYFQVVNKKSELVLAAEKEAGDVGSNVVQAKNTGADNQVWSFVYVPDDKTNTFMLRNKASGHFIGAGTLRRDTSFLLKLGAGGGIRWELDRDGFQFMIRNHVTSPSYYLVVDDGSKEPGANVIRAKTGKETKDAGDEFRWNLVPAKPK